MRHFHHLLLPLLPIKLNTNWHLIIWRGNRGLRCETETSRCELKFQSGKSSFFLFLPRRRGIWFWLLVEGSFRLRKRKSQRLSTDFAFNFVSLFMSQSLTNSNLICCQESNKRGSNLHHGCETSNRDWLERKKGRNRWEADWSLKEVEGHCWSWKERLEETFEKLFQKERRHTYYIILIFNPGLNTFTKFSEVFRDDWRQTKDFKGVLKKHSNAVFN